MQTTLSDCEMARGDNGLIVNSIRVRTLFGLHVNLSTLSADNAHDKP